jgi:hypothetical protein
VIPGQHVQRGTPFVVPRRRSGGKCGGQLEEGRVATFLLLGIITFAEGMEREGALRIGGSCRGWAPLRGKERIWVGEGERWEKGQTKGGEESNEEKKNRARNGQKPGKTLMDIVAALRNHRVAK